MKWYLLFYLLLFFLVVFVLPTWRVWKQTGVNPMVLPKNDTAYGFVGKAFKVLMGLIFAVVLVNAFAPHRMVWLSPIHYLSTNWASWTGFALLHFALILVALAQAEMKRSWRIGIDEARKTELVTGGIFRRSRNPIFLGLLLAMLGLFLVLPNALTLCLLVASYLVIQVQVRLEEDFLERSHGAAYQNYRRQVRRWI